VAGRQLLQYQDEIVYLEEVVVVELLVEIGLQID